MTGSPFARFASSSDSVISLDAYTVGHRKPVATRIEKQTNRDTECISNLVIIELYHKQMRLDTNGKIVRNLGQRAMITFANADRWETKKNTLDSSILSLVSICLCQYELPLLLLSQANAAYCQCIISFGNYSLQKPHIASHKVFLCYKLISSILLL